MTQVVLISHGRLAEALLSTAQMIMGPLPGIRTIALEPGMGIEDVRDALRKILSGSQAGTGVLALLDLFGGSPATACAGVQAGEPRLEVISGLNLPMLLETLMNMDNLEVKDLARLASGKGKEGIIDLRSALAD